MKNLLTLFVFSILTTPLLATGYLGGGFSYKSLGDGKFEISFDYVKDCNDCSGNSCSPPNLKLEASGYSKEYSWTLDTTISLNPSNRCFQCNKCEDPTCTFAYGVQLLRYSTEVDLSTQLKQGKCSFTGSLTLSSISKGITTGLSGRVYQEIVFDACLENELSPSTKYGGLIALGRDYIANHRVTSADGDSLAYELAPLVSKPGNSLSYSSPYGHEKPLSYLGFPEEYTIDKFPFGFNLDPATGDLLFRPMKLEQTAYRIKVTEYRNGKKISESYRDNFFSVIKVPSNNPPVISGINCSKPVAANFKMEACVGEKICFTVCTSDKDKADTNTLEWNEGIPGATFTVLNKGDKRENARFCWTPTPEDGNSKFPFRFVVTAKDQGCPTSGFGARTFQIKVNPLLKVKMNVKEVGCGKVSVHLKNISNAKVSQWILTLDKKEFHYKGGSNDTTVILNDVTPKDHSLSLTAVAQVGCAFLTDTTFATISEPVIVIDNFIHEILCLDKSPFQKDISSNLSNFKTFKWLDNNSSSTTRTWTEKEDGLYKFLIKNGQCTDSGTVYIDFQHIDADFTKKRGVGDLPLTVEFIGNDNGDNKHHEWKFEENGQDITLSGLNPSHTFTTTGQYDITHTVSGLNRKCPETVTKTKFVNVFPTSINELKEFGLDVFPNPVSNVLNIHSTHNEPVELKILDTKGAVVLDGRLEKGSNQFNISHLPNSTYYVHLSNGKWSRYTILVKE